MSDTVAGGCELNEIIDSCFPPMLPEALLGRLPKLVSQLTAS